MAIKPYAYTILLGTVTLYSVAKAFGALIFTGPLEYVLLFWIGWGVIQIVVPYATAFITLPKEFLWFWLVGSILGTLYLVFVGRVLPGVTLQSVTLPAQTLLFININRFVFADTAVAVLTSVGASFLLTLFKSLQSSK